jgi:DNA-binding response OmpR family regulator
MQTILCVDDNRLNLATLCLILRGNGYHCVTAENSSEADRRFAAGPVHLAIVDHGLPGMNGSELAVRLKSIRHVLVLMLTGNPSVVSKPAGVDLLLAKPIDSKSLLSEIEHLLLQHTA